MSDPSTLHIPNVFVPNFDALDLSEETELKSAKEPKVPRGRKKADKPIADKPNAQERKDNVAPLKGAIDADEMKEFDSILNNMEKSEKADKPRKEAKSSKKTDKSMKANL